jgi:hypothetical protein
MDGRVNYQQRKSISRHAAPDCFQMVTLVCFDGELRRRRTRQRTAEQVPNSRTPALPCPLQRADDCLQFDRILRHDHLLTTNKTPLR